jgi:hypothetical protein
VKKRPVAKKWTSPLPPFPELNGPAACPESLDFPGRTSLLLTEMAKKLKCSFRHLLNEVDCGALTVLDLRTERSPRRWLRVPIECYREYICRRLSGPVESRLQFLHSLPAKVRHELIAALQQSLRASAP